MRKESGEGGEGAKRRQGELSEECSLAVEHFQQLAIVGPLQGVDGHQSRLGAGGGGDGSQLEEALGTAKGWEEKEKGKGTEKREEGRREKKKKASCYSGEKMTIPPGCQV